MINPKENHPEVRKRLFRLSPDILFLWIGLLVGGAFCVFIPFAAGFDEETHLARIWEVSALHLLPNDTGKNNTASVPLEFFTLSYQRRYFQTPAQDLLQAPSFTQTIDRQTLLSYNTRSIYPPNIFFPQAFVVGVAWRLLDLPVVPTAIAARLAGLLVYVVGAFFAIRFLPAGKWVMFTLAIAPMALYQAATLNADGYTMAACFLFISYTLKVFADRPAPIQRSQALGLIGLTLAVGLAKQGTFVVLPLLLILGYSRFSKRAWFFMVWGAALAAVGLAFGWSMLVIGRSDFGGAASSSDLIGHIKLALANPADFISLYVRGIYLSYGKYYEEWVGVYGHWLGPVPEIIYKLYPAAVISAVLADSKSALSSWKVRLQVIGMFLLSAGGLILLFALIYYQVGNNNFGGVQGRYFLALTPLLFIPLAGWIRLPDWMSKVIRGLSFLLVFATLATYSYGMYAIYYTDCEGSIFTHGPCAQPIYKNIDKANAPFIEVNQTQQVGQTFFNVCGKLEAVQVWIKSVQPGAAGELRFELLDDAGRQIASIDTPMTEVTGYKYLTLPVNPPSGLRGKTYQLRVSAPDTPPGKGARAAISESVHYTQGKLSINDQEVKADLIFKYICVDPFDQ
jgi:uncharacterized membrane protein